VRNFSVELLEMVNKSLKFVNFFSYILLFLKCGILSDEK
jgi:hypothetical protein